MINRAIKVLLRPSGAHEEFRSYGAWMLMIGLVALVIVVLAEMAGVDQSRLTGGQIAAGAFLALGIFGLTG